MLRSLREALLADEHSTAFAVAMRDAREEAYRLYQAGQIGEAARLCRRLREWNPAHPEATYLLGVIAQDGGELEHPVPGDERRQVTRRSVVREHAEPDAEQKTVVHE